MANLQLLSILSRWFNRKPALNRSGRRPIRPLQELIIPTLEGLEERTVPAVTFSYNDLGTSGSVVGNLTFDSQSPDEFTLTSDGTSTDYTFRSDAAKGYGNSATLVVNPSAIPVQTKAPPATVEVTTFLESVKLLPNLAAGSILNLDRDTPLASLTGAGTVQPWASTSAGRAITLGVPSATTATFSGVLQDNTKVLSLIVNQSGTEILTGTNTYTGTTKIQAGTLRVNGSLAGASAVTVPGGTLSGTGTVGAVTVTASGTLAPGAAVGTLNTGAISLDSTSNFSAGINSAAAYSKDKVTGTVNLGSSTLNIALGYNPTYGTAFTLVENDGTDAVTGTFNGLAEGAKIDIGVTKLQISYIGGDGNDVVLTTISKWDTTTVVASSNNPSIYGSTVTFTATVSPAPGTSAIVPTGTVTFFAGATNLGTATMASGAATWALSTLYVGAYSITAAYNGDAKYNTSLSGAITQTVTPAALTITAAANTKTYDATITAAALPTVAGLQNSDTVTGLSETYDNANAGTGKTLTVATYTVNDGNGGANYTVTTVTSTAGIINKANQSIAWSNPSAITYGTVLTGTELNAVASGVSGGTAPGALTYSPAAGTLLDAGSQNLMVTAAATTNYLVATKSVTLVVNKALQTITWANPANISYGTLLSATELNATVAGSSTAGASAPGALTYSPAAGTLLNAGSQTLSVTAAATTNYLAATKSVTLVVDQAAQTITWANPANITYGTLLSSTELNATVAGSSTGGASAPGALTYSPVTGTLLNAGSQTLTVNAAATSNYLAATKSVTLVVDQATQTITWANPANITYGTLLSSTELNATVAGSSTGGTSAPGALTYSPVAGTLLNAGSQTLTVNAAATSNYLAATKSVTLVVDQATQTITWANPANITYGTLLSSTELNATVAGSSTVGASAPGALTYSPAAGTLLNAGSQTLTVTAAATSNYLVATKSVTLVVDKALQTITWANPANITYGTLLSATELNATAAGSSTPGASAPGALTYSPAAGTLLNAGSQTLSVTAAATSNYLAATKSVTLVVDQAAQTITWANPANITYGTLLSSTELNATVAGSSTIGASAPGALTYSPVAGTLLNAGSQTLTVNAAATSNYLAATKSVTLVVDKALQTITWANPANITYGTLLSSTELNATVAGSSTTGATAPGALTYSPAAGGLLNAGSQTLNVTAAATSNYLAATEAVTLVVDQAVQTITWVDPANIIYGTLLSSTELNATVAGSSTTGASAPGALTYSPAAGTLLNTGIQTLTVNAAATGNYLAATKSVTLVVDQAVQTITWANPANITYGTLLSATELNATVAGSSTAGASAPGALTYSPTAGTLLNAGSQTLTVTAAATSNYLAATQSVTLVVDKALQTITWANPANADYGNLISLTQLNATVVGVSTPGATDPGALVYSPVLGTLLDAGNNILTVTALGTANYLQATAQVDWFIDKIDQIITWARPQAITYGTVLSATQLNATVDGSSTPGASAPGLLTYSPTAGTLLNAGIQVLNVTAAATNNYNAASASVNQTVNQAVQTITWVTPANIVYGTLLSSTQLNAVVAGSSTPGASSPGALSYTPPAGTLLNAGTQTLQVTAAATLNYLQATGQVNLIVEKANQAITWNTPAPITYGTRLSGTQLNASVAGVSGGTPAGALSYTPPANTLLNAGTNRLTVTAAATANYNAASQGVDLVVNKAAQSIAWVTPAAITYGTLLSGTQLNAVASGVSGGSAAGALSYTPPAGTLLDAGSQTLSVTAAATSNYLVAVNTVTLLVNKAAQTITWANPANILQGTPLSSTQLNATVTGSSTAGATPPGALTYTPGTGTVLPDGPNTLTVNAAATSNYLQAQRSVTLVVDEAPVFTSANATTMVAGTLGSFSLTTTGYPARTYSVTGALPAGVTLAPSTGVLSGTAAPLTGGIYAVVMGATNGVLPNASQNFTLTVNEAPAFTSAASAIFLEGIANTFTVTASGFPAPRFAITSGTLPQGLSFNTTTGVVSGTAALGILGTYPVVVTASNGIAPIAVQNLSIHVYRNVPVATGAVLTTPFNLGSGSYVVSLGNGSVLIHNPSGVEQQFAPFPGFTGTLSTSLVDRNGDGTADSILVAVATGGSPAVLVVDSATGRVAYNFYAFAPGFFGGVSVAGGVTTYQGKVTTVVLGGAGPGAEPSISAFDAVTGQARGAFYAFDPHYTGGVRVAMTGPDSTGASLIIGSPAINSNIVLFSLDQPNVALASFYAFMPPDLYRGTWVAGGDLDGDGISEVVVGAGPGTNGKAEVSVFNLAGRQLANFLAFSQGFTGGVSVAVSDYNSDGKGDIFCSSGAGAQATFNVFSYPDLALMDAVFLPTSSLLGTFVANNPSA